MIKIDKCVCYRKSFKEILFFAKQENIKDIDTLADRTCFGDKCGMCVPYVKLALKTGKTEFSAIVREDEK